MLKGILFVACVLACTGSAEADVPKCSNPDVLAGIKEKAIAELYSSYDVLGAERASAIKQMRFPHGSPDLDFDAFVGKAVDEATRHCAADIVLRSPDMTPVGTRFEYEVSATEDGKLLFTFDDRPEGALRQLLRSYDIENKLNEKVDTEVGIALGLIPSPNSPRLLDEYNRENPDLNKPAPRADGQMTSDFGMGSSKHPSSRQEQR